MSEGNQAAGPSTDGFSAIYNAALTEYQRVMGMHLDTHPFAAKLDTCDSPEAVVSNILRTQAQAFSKSRWADEKLMAWLNSISSIAVHPRGPSYICTTSSDGTARIVHILSVISGTPGEELAVILTVSLAQWARVQALTLTRAL